MSASIVPAAGQCWNAQGYADDAGFVPALGAPVLDLLAPQPGERILDLGCGDGVLTARLAASGADVLGVDASPELVAAARARGVEAQVLDGHALAFEPRFDAVFSNAALHWMREPDRVLDGVRRALRPGGRFVGEFGGHGNVAAIVTALHAARRLHGVPAPAFAWFFPSADAYAQRLQAHGFQVTQIALLPRPTPLPTGMVGWLRTFADPFLIGVDAATRQDVLATAVALLAPTLCDDRGRWSADYVRLRFHAILSAQAHA
ncbi:class I SAM-dependent methyltransferase [Xanthomonas theicola]|uniref:SAM-dependent methyltransferase n=1 Tax=Xanthomonas theicola TaxID=56464 RepID=A0A2S6Z9P2_9XANT|nr:class I SAM-dependent methyltransferase [Xanthomonas theicola]PPT78533.1 SAM-dependent methyltransferase [Xanthomonas theicola]QNH26067.1 methyltransferase domain-containing protein [Xanthomonas theicola]